MLLRAVVSHIADEQAVPANGLRTRLEAGVSVLNELGGLAKIEEHANDTFATRSYSCPFTAAVPGHPEICRLTEALLMELAGVPVCERCDRGESPRCCFEIAPADDNVQEDLDR